MYVRGGNEVPLTPSTQNEDKQGSASPWHFAVAKSKGQAVRKGVWGGVTGGGREAEEAFPVRVKALMALPAHPECLLVQPRLVHLFPAAQHHPGRETCQVLPPHGHC